MPGFPYNNQGYDPASENFIALPINDFNGIYSEIENSVEEYHPTELGSLTGSQEDFSGVVDEKVFVQQGLDIISGLGSDINVEDYSGVVQNIVSGIRQGEVYGVGILSSQLESFNKTSENLQSNIADVGLVSVGNFGFNKSAFSGIIDDQRFVQQGLEIIFGLSSGINPSNYSGSVQKIFSQIPQGEVYGVGMLSSQIESFRKEFVNLQSNIVEVGLMSLGSLGANKSVFSGSVRDIMFNPNPINQNNAELDPIFIAWKDSFDNHEDWDTAYGWGDHAGLYDLLGAASGAASGAVSAHEDDYDHTVISTIYSWGDHAGLYDFLGTAAGAVSAHEDDYDHSLIDSALQPSDIASGTITARADDINFSGGSEGDVLTVQSDGSLALQEPTGGPGAVSNYYTNTYTYTSAVAHQIVHNFGVYPVVSAYDSTGKYIIPYDITNVDINTVSVTFYAAGTYTIVLSCGAAGATSDERVKLNVGDTTAGYLDDKITGYGFLTNGYNTAPLYFGIGKGTTTFGFLAGETGQTAVQSAVIATDAGKASTISVQGAGQAYFMGRDITNSIEFVMGTSTLGGAFAGSMTNHPFWLRTNNSTHWTVGTTGNFMAGTDGTGNKNITTAGQIKGGTGLIGSTANFTDFANAKLVISKDNTGSVSAAVASAVGEATSDGTNPGVGFLGFGASSAAGSGIGVYGVGRPTSATDEASVYGFYGQAIYAHTGGLNIGGRFDAEAGTYGNIGVYGIAKAPTTALQSNTTKAVYGYAKTGGGASYANHAIGGYFRGFVADTNDTGYCYGIQAIATDTHAGGRNYAIYASASGGTASYSFFSDYGVMYQAGTAQFQTLLGIREGGSTPTYYTYFQGGDQAASITYTLPTALPASNKFLQCTSAGVWSWETAGGGSPGGADTQIQFNDGGAFGGSDKFVYNKTTGLISSLLTGTGSTVTSSFYAKNATDATVSTPQYSPAFHQVGSSYKTGTGAGAYDMEMRSYLKTFYSGSAQAKYIWELKSEYHTAVGWKEIMSYDLDSETFKFSEYASSGSVSMYLPQGRITSVAGGSTAQYTSKNINISNGADGVLLQQSTDATVFWLQCGRNTADAGGFYIYSYPGNPNGHGLIGLPGSTCHDTNGGLWLKTTSDTYDTGWLPICATIFDSISGNPIIHTDGSFVV